MSRTKSRGGFRARERGGKRGGHKGNGNWAGRQPRQDFQEIKKQNEQFERFYNELNIVPEGQEREQFWAALKRELPNSFRFAGSKGHALAVQKNLTDRYIPQITSVEFDGESVPAPTQIPWYPASLAWQMTTPKHIVRKFPPFAAFQKFLVSETAVGNISRQEVVSMIPPLVMDVKPHHAVLDMCAAPGSKSAQIVEMLHAGEEARIRKVVLKARRDLGMNGGQSPEAINPVDEVDEGDDWPDDGRTTGLFVANDSNYQRAQMLVHQVKRLNSPNLIIMNHDATMFPSIELPSEAVVEGERPKGRWLKFDRILADVPCSGDGTARKNPNVWKDWAPANGLGLHLIQVRILVRALQMLKVGGRVIYSTCSMNPVENEAVVQSAIDRCGGATKVEIVDCEDRLQGLQRKPGLSSWKVIDKTGRIWNKWEDVEEAKSKKADPSLERLVPGMFSGASELPFQRCMRVYPHLQDTGAFFITVLEKKTEIRAKPEAPAKLKNKAPSIVTVAKEVESKAGEHGVVEMGAVEEFMEQEGAEVHGANMDQGNASAAERQNEETLEEATLPWPNKRSLDTGVSETAQTKRAKVEMEVLDTETIGEVGQTEDRPASPVDQSGYSSLANGESTPNGHGVVTEKGSRRRNAPHEEAFKYLPPDHEEIQSIFKFYGLPDRFPRDRFMVRNEMGEPAKTIYYTTDLSKKILTKNEGKGMKFVHSGIKMFVKQDVQGADTCRWRIQTEGLPIIEGWVGEDRVVRIYKKRTLQFLLLEMFPKVSAEELGEAREAIFKMGMGCSVCRVEPSEGEDGFSERMVLPIWRSMASVNLMLPKEDRRAMLLRIYNDDTALVDHSQSSKFKNGRSAGSKDAGEGEKSTEQTRELAGSSLLSDDEEGGVSVGQAADSSQGGQPAGTMPAGGPEGEGGEEVVNKTVQQTDESAERWRSVHRSH